MKQFKKKIYMLGDGMGNHLVDFSDGVVFGNVRVVGLQGVGGAQMAGAVRQASRRSLRKGIKGIEAIQAK